MAIATPPKKLIGFVLILDAYESVHVGMTSWYGLYKPGYDSMYPPNEPDHRIKGSLEARL